MTTHVNNIIEINIENINNESIEKKRIKNKIKKEKPNTTLSYNEYIKDENILKKYKIPELKSIAKHLRLFITGSKPVLIDRIKVHFEKSKKAIIIQKIFRGYIVKKSFQLRGDAFKNRSLCVNNTDFYTLEPLETIDFELFYSYKDTKDFHYGFNINSLIQLMKNKTKTLLNPYNRENFSKENITDIISLYNKIHLLFPKILEPEDDLTMIKKPNILYNNINTTNIVINSENLDSLQEIQNRLQHIREKSIPVRINELCMEIDQLGNYTDALWFSSLELRDYIKLYRTLYEIWNYRAQLSIEMKRKICVFGNPFLNIFIERTYYNDLSLARIKEACLIVFENLVYSGIDIEHRKIGTMHALSALTIVSLSARNAMPWLYESVNI
jgi:hypothetical protein